MCICAYAYHPTSLSHRVGRIHHIDRVYFEIHAPRMGLESTLLFIRHPKTNMIINVNFQPYSKIDCFVLIDTMREGGETPLAHIAQSVERSPLKRMAAGSIPVVGISLFFSRAAISVAGKLIIYHHSPSLFISSLCVLNSCFFLTPLIQKIRDTDKKPKIISNVFWRTRRQNDDAIA